MNFGSMKTQVSSLLKDPNNTAVSTSDVGSALNAALAYWKKKRFWFNEAVDTNVSISDGDSVISDMPSDILFPLQKGGIVLDYQERRYRLEKINTAQYDLINIETQAQPRFYTYRAGQYEIYPYADQDYTGIVRYIKDYAAFSADGDTNDFTDEADWMLIYEAASRLSSDQKQDAEMAQIFAGRAREEYQRLLGQTNKLNATGSLSVYY